MTEILMAITMIAIGTASLAFGGIEVFIFSLCAGIYFIHDIVEDMRDGKTYRRHRAE